MDACNVIKTNTTLVTHGTSENIEYMVSEDTFDCLYEDNEDREQTYTSIYGMRDNVSEVLDQLDIPVDPVVIDERTMEGEKCLPEEDMDSSSCQDWNSEEDSYENTEEEPSLFCEFGEDGNLFFFEIESSSEHDDADGPSDGSKKRRRDNNSSEIYKRETLQKHLMHIYSSLSDWHPFLNVDKERLALKIMNDPKMQSRKRQAMKKIRRKDSSKNTDSISQVKEIYCLNKKRGRPSDHEVKICWSNLKMPKVRLTLEEKKMPPYILENYGDCQRLPKYLTNILENGRCAFCFKEWKRSCLCKCFQGHNREQCGAYPTKECSESMLTRRHDCGFHPTQDLMYGSKMIMVPNKDPLVKKAEFKVNRGCRIRYYMNKASCNLATIVISSIKYHRQHRNAKDTVPCPICFFTDKSRNAFYSICNGCKSSNMIKPYFGVYRRQAGVPVRRRKVVRKTKKNEKVPVLPS